MALIACPDCHRAVSHHAATCPGCGRPLQMPTWARPSSVRQIEAEKQNLQIAYGLYAGSFVVGLLAIASVIFCYVKRGDVRGTAAAWHYDWLIETFWTHVVGVLAGTAVLVVLVLIGAGLVLAYLLMLALILFAVGYPIYRLVVGFRALSACRGPYEGGRPQW